MRMREDTLTKLEEAGDRMRKSGLCRAWFGDADQCTLDVAGGCNGQLFEQLLTASGYHEVDCVNLLRGGANELINIVCC